MDHIFILLISNGDRTIQDIFEIIISQQRTEKIVGLESLMLFLNTEKCDCFISVFQKQLFYPFYYIYNMDKEFQGKQENTKFNAGETDQSEKKKGNVGQKLKTGEIKTPKGTRDYYPYQMSIRRKVIDQIVQIFQKHGGVEIDTPVFELKEILHGKYGEQSGKLIYDLEDQGGEKCSLRYDLTVPFARFMANNTNIQKIKRFHIGKVYRRDQPIMTKGRFREFYQCDYDIAGKYDLMIPDAEIISIMQEILQALKINQFVVKVNHRKILEMLVHEAGCDPEKFKAICSSIDKLDKQDWSQIEQQLIQSKGLTKQQAEIIGKICQIKGNPDEVVQKLINEKIFSNKHENVLPFISQMSLLFKYLKAMNRISKVSFDLSLARGLDYYTGLIYEIVLIDKTIEVGSISGGGRYDQLIGMFSQNQIPAVGGSIGIQRIFTLLEKKYQAEVKENPCQILVATIKQVPVEQKLRALSSLWASDIKAETLYVEKSKTDKQLNYALTNKIPMILWIGQEELKNGQANLKILYKHKEVKVSLADAGGQSLEHVLLFRKDLKEGKVDFTDPNKK